MAMLKQGGARLGHWASAARYAAHLVNLEPMSRDGDNRSPVERLTGCAPDLAPVRMFWARMWGALAAEQRAHKFSDRAVEGRFVGLAANGAAWVLYSTNLVKNKHFTVVQATFDEADLLHGGDVEADSAAPDGEIEWPWTARGDENSEDCDGGEDGFDEGAGGRALARAPSGGTDGPDGGDAGGADGPAAGDASEGATAGGGSVAGDDDGGDAGSGDKAPRSRMLDELRPDRGFVSQMPPPDAVTVGARPDGGGFSLRPRLGALPSARAALVAEAEEWADRACNAWSLMQGGGDEFDDSAEHGYAFVSCVDSKKYVADERECAKFESRKTMLRRWPAPSRRIGSKLSKWRSIRLRATTRMSLYQKQKYLNLVSRYSTARWRTTSRRMNSIA